MARRARSIPAYVDRRGARIDDKFVTAPEREQALAWLETIVPLWERRFSDLRPLPAGETQRELLRPVWWLGNWQFACLGYYHPPQGTFGRCVRAEPFPAPLDAWVARIEERIRGRLPAAWIPAGFRLNTCLVNLYGDRLLEGRRDDRARVGAHRDFEPGPVASVSLGARAFFQFTTAAGALVDQTWLADRSLQVIAGPHFKDRCFHRVQRVERSDTLLPPYLPDFAVRRVNFTFRFVPEAHVVDLAAMEEGARAEIAGYVATLAQRSPFWADQLKASQGRGAG